jgi:hypothetical protein
VAPTTPEARDLAILRIRKYRRAVDDARLRGIGHRDLDHVDTE